MITITLNGEPSEIPRPMTVTELLVHLSLAGTRVAVELDREIVPRAARDEARVDEGAIVEIVHFVGGGC